MAIIIEDFPSRSDDPDLQPPLLPATPQQIEVEATLDLKILARLLIGTAIEGSDEFRRRGRLWQAELNIPDPSRTVISTEHETDAALLRYSLIGFLFQAIDAGYDGLTFFGKVSSKAYSKVSRIFAPLTRSRLWRPVQEHYDSYSVRGESIVHSWINLGRREEQVSRAMARKQAYEDLVNEVIGYLAQKPEVRQLVQEQSVGMAEEIVGDIRNTSVEFDSILEKRVNAILRRRPNP